MDNIMNLYNQGYSIAYIIEAEFYRLNGARAADKTLPKPTLKIARENVYSIIYENLIIQQRKGQGS